MVKTPSFGVRLRLALSILGDAALAQRLLDLRDAKPAPAALPPKPVEPPKEKKGPSYEDGALVVLAILQREGRFLDFVGDDVATASDADVAAAARVVHEGCRAALKRHVDVVPLRDDAEGSVVTIEPGYDANATKLTGKVTGKGPWKGSLRHKGWRATSVTLPQPAIGHDATALAAAEVEID